MRGFRPINRKAGPAVSVNKFPLQQAPPSALPGSMRKHIFNKYPVAFGGVLDEDVGDGAYQLVVLDDGAEIGRASCRERV